MNNPTQDIRAIQTTTGLPAAVASMTVCAPVDVLLPAPPYREGAQGEAWRGSSLQLAHGFNPVA